MKTMISVLVFLVCLCSCETTNIYPTKVVEVAPAAKSLDANTAYTDSLDCSTFGGHKKGNTCESNCAWCSSQEICIDTTGDSWKDTCVQGETPIAPPSNPTPTTIPISNGCVEDLSTNTKAGNWCASGNDFSGTIQCVGGNWVCVKDAFTWCADADQDGYRVCDGTCLIPADATNAQCGDCNDFDATVHPGAKEICDDVDRNCDGNTDTDLMTVFRPDMDGDGFGDSFSKITLACKTPEGFAGGQMDCNDGNVDISPAATEVCGDTIDNNCNGQVDEICPSKVDPSEVDADGDGFKALVDCNDNDATIHPGLDSCPTLNGLTKDSYKLVLVWGGAENSPWTANAYFKFGMSANDLQFSSKAFFDNTWEKKSFPQYHYTATDLDKNSSHVAFNVFGYPGYWYLCAGSVVDTISFSLSKELPKIYLVSGGVWQEVSNKLEVLAANDLEVVKGPIYGGDYNKGKPAYCAAMLKL